MRYYHLTIAGVKGAKLDRKNFLTDPNNQPFPHGSFRRHCSDNYPYNAVRKPSLKAKDHPNPQFTFSDLFCIPDTFDG